MSTLLKESQLTPEEIAKRLASTLKAFAPVGGPDMIFGNVGQDGYPGEVGEPPRQTPPAGGVDMPAPPPVEQPPGDEPIGPEEPAPGEAEPPDDDSEGGDGEGEGEGEGDGEDGDGEGEGGEGGPDENSKTERVSREDLKRAQDAASRRAEEGLGNKESTKDKEREVGGKESTKEFKSKANGSPGTGKGGGGKFSYESVKPSMSWKQILDKLIVAPVSQTEDSYLKPSRKTITSITQAAQSGAAAIKPGEKVSEFLRPRLVIVVDGSGSMSSAVAMAFANIEALFKRNAQLANETFFLVKFSSQFETYLCSVKNGAAVYLDKLDEHNKLPNNIISSLSSNKDLQHVFTNIEAGGTMFVDPMVSELNHMLSKDYNVLLFTDTDIVHGQNFTNLKAMYKKYKKNLFVIMDSREAWVQLVKTMGGVPGNFSHM